MSNQVKENKSEKKFEGEVLEINDELVGGVCNLVISVDLLSKLFPPQIQHKTLQSRERNGIEHNEH